MTRCNLSRIALCAALIVGLGCARSPEEKKAEEAAEQFQESAEQMSKAMEQGAEGMAEAMQKMGEALGGGKRVEPVSFRDLKKLLPESVLGMERTSPTGERTAAFGIKVSQAEATYRSEDGKRIRIKIIDMGSMSSLAAMTAYGWAMADLERETDTGYERTTTFKGYKAFEKYDNVSKSGEIQVLVAERFVVEIDGDGVTAKELRSVLSEINLGKLEKMKGHGVEE